MKDIAFNEYTTNEYKGTVFYFDSLFDTKRAV